MNLFSLFGNLPGPIKILVTLASGASIVSIGALFSEQYRPLGIWILIGVAAVAVIVILYKLFMYLREKGKSGPFAKLLSKGSGSGALSPEEKARQDQLRQKFEEGVETYRKAGKDLYSLPWFLLVGPAGSGKTEAIRRSSVPFPSGLQDQLQGVGGTISMHWWFTNNAVVLDTAGALFMGGLDGPRAGEWKSFMQLLRKTRTNCPINGLLLVISSESLLKDSNEQIEQTAGILARQLDLVQRTLDVRFPVNIVITKCDKIVGFREFFETLNDPILQHQILGWTNPAPLDEVFKPETVEKHLEGVRQKLMRRRLGLIQNPVHTADPTARRTDQVDELFELPHNLSHIGPRLRRYLEMIFVAGEWSPKPLFLRGIYFTSSMRQGQVLDMALASALGIDAETIPSSRQWDEERAYFLRDVFVSKVFAEKGLVTRASNVSKQITTQRRAIAIGSIAATILIGGFTVYAWLGFRASLGPAADFWRKVRVLVVGDVKKGQDPVDLALIGVDAKDKGKVVYRGNENIDTLSDLPENVEKRAQLLVETARKAREVEELPPIAKPLGLFLDLGDGFVESKTKTHRALVDACLTGPLMREARSKIFDEEAWSPEAVATLAQLIRVETYALGEKPSEGRTGGLVGDIKSRASGDKNKAPVMDADPMLKYVLGEAEYERKDGLQAQRTQLLGAAAEAYKSGFDDDNPPGPALAAKDEASVERVKDAVDQFIKQFLSARSPDLDKIENLRKAVTAFRDAENALLNIQWLKPGTGGAGATAAFPKSANEYDEFADAYMKNMQNLTTAKTAIDAAVKELGGTINDPVNMVREKGEALRVAVDGYFELLLSQLPGSGGLGVDLGGKADKAADAAEKALASKLPPALRELRENLTDNRGKVAQAVSSKIDSLVTEFKGVAPLLVAGKTGSTDQTAYSVRYDAYRLALDEITRVMNASGAPDAATARAFGVRVSSMDTDAADMVSTIDALGSWTPGTEAIKPLDGEQQKAVTTDRDAAIQASRRVVSAAQGRRLYDLAHEAVSQWYKDKDEMAADVAKLADQRLTEGAAGFKRWQRPPVPLSDYESGGDFKSEYHPDGARELLGGWGKLADLVEPASSGQRWMLGATDLARTREYDTAKRVAELYAQDYLDYWKRQATEDSRAAAKSWTDYAAKVKNVDRDSVNRVLKVLRERIVEAVDAMPARLTTREWFPRGKDEIINAFKGLDSQTFGDRATRTLRAWQDLSRDAAGAESVRGKLRTAFSDGILRRNYFQVYAPAGDPEFVAYWNSLAVNGLETLVAETQPKLDQARKALLAGGGIPLGLGGAGAKTLTRAQVQAVKVAVDDLGTVSTPRGNTDASASEDLPPEILNLIETLSGKTFIDRDEKTRTWFSQLKEVVAAVSGKQTLEATISGSIDPGLGVPRGVTAGDARDSLSFARLYVGDQLVERAFPTDKEPLADLAPKLKVAFPSPGDVPIKINLYKVDPRGADPAPDAVITLNGPWGPLGRMLTDAGQGQSRDDGAWNVALVTDDQRHYWWVTLKFNNKVPAKDQWPLLERWPKE